MEVKKNNSHIVALGGSGDIGSTNIHRCFMKKLKFSSFFPFNQLGATWVEGGQNA